MAQQKPVEKHLQTDRNCVSNADSCGYSANHSASPHTTTTDQEILACVGLAAPATTFSSDQSGKILHLFPKNLAPTPSNVPQHIRDIENLSLAKLKKAYNKEHNSWRSRKSYAEEHGIAFHKPWQDFRNYLRELGPIPAEGHTLDKTDPSKGYIPGNVRWASKEEQTYNRYNTTWLIHDGERLPLGAWANRTGQAESTLRWRKSQCWPDENVITGHPPAKPLPQNSTLPPQNHPWPIGHAQPWESMYRRETGGQGSRFKFMAHFTAKRLIELTEEVDSVCYPEDHDPTPEEVAALEDHARANEYWVKFWQHVQRGREKLCGEIFPNLGECVRLCS